MKKEYLNQCRICKSKNINVSVSYLNHSDYSENYISSGPLKSSDKLSKEMIHINDSIIDLKTGMVIIKQFQYEIIDYEISCICDTKYNRSLLYNCFGELCYLLINTIETNEIKYSFDFSNDDNSCFENLLLNGTLETDECIDSYFFLL